MRIVVFALTLFAGPFEDAKTVNHLDSFLEQYVGTCDRRPTAERPACAKALSEHRRGTDAGLHLVSGDARAQISIREFDERAGELTLRVLPFWSAGGRALTGGRPRGLTADGSPLVRTFDLKVKLPEDEPAFIGRRRFELGRVDVTWVLRTRSAWSLRRAGETVEGVEAELVALRITEPRTGEQVAEKIW